MTLDIDRYSSFPDDEQTLAPTLRPAPTEPPPAVTVAPPRRWRTATALYVAGVVAADAVVCAVIVGALTSREGSLPNAALAALVAGLAFVTTVALCRGYARPGGPVGAALAGLSRATGVLAVASLLIHYVELVPVPPSLVTEALALTVLLALAGRFVARLVFAWLRSRGAFVRRALLVGPTASLDPVFAMLDDAPNLGLVVVATCAPQPTVGPEVSDPVTGDYDAIPDLVRTRDIDAVLVSADAMSATALRRLGWRLADRSVDLLVVPSITEVSPRRLRVESLGGTPVLGVALTPPRPSLWAKAVLDRTQGSVLLLLAAPLVAVAGVAVRLTSSGPAFFAQTRVGIDGRPFVMYKLRSMYLDAEERLAEFAALNDGNGMLFKLHDDPRVTRLGALMRRLSIDELPQLWNVVRGDMSLVGPRPALPSEVARFDEDMLHRLRVKPGLTGLWQVSGRSNLSAEQSERLDLRYTDNWSVRMDISILWRTGRAVLRGTGAY